MIRKLKVYRTPIGFHDAYVAASSQKAALEAWGADVDLFARGAAEVVTDDSLIKEPLEKPGTIIRRLRGSNDEHLAALTEQENRRAQTIKPLERAGSKPAKTVTTDEPEKPKPRPKPSRLKLAAVEEKLDRLVAAQAAERDELRKQELALQQQRRKVEERQESEIAKIEAAIRKQRLAYEDALEKWRS